jgi:hypothetical protein
MIVVSVGEHGTRRTERSQHSRNSTPFQNLPTSDLLARHDLLLLFRISDRFVSRLDKEGGGNSRESNLGEDDLRVKKVSLRMSV